jgi:integrase
MPTARISKRSVDELGAGPKEVFLWDDQLKGFGLRVTAQGSKSYVLQYRMGGRESSARRYTIGGHGSPWTPEKARKEAERLMMLVRQGIDPVQADQERRRQAVDLAFDAYVDNFTNLYLKKRWKQWQLGAGVLRREAVPVLREKPLPKIKRSDLNPIWDRMAERPAVARLTHATLRKLFRWAVSRGDLDRSPLEGVDPPPPVPARDRVLADGELAALWWAVEELRQPFTGFFKLLILTGQRREEVAGMDWAELDRDAELWTIPGFRTKNGQPQLVPLSRSALEVLDGLGDDSWRKRGLVFSTTGSTPVSGFSKVKARVDELMQEKLSGDSLPAWRVHDIRRTVATGLQRLGVRFEVTEAVLNHVSGSRSGISGVYQRHNWADEKRDALDKWAVHVEATKARFPRPDNSG